MELTPALKMASGTPPKNDKPTRPYLRAEERRQSILEAAREVFSRTSLQGARTRELAKAAGVNQATLYGHFESKEALFSEAVVEPMVEAMQGLFERAETMEKASSPEEFLALAAEASEHHLEAMVSIFPLLASALFSDAELGARLYHEHISPLFDERSQVSATTVRSDLDSRTLSLFSFGLCFAVAMDRHFCGDTRSLSEMARLIALFSSFGFAEERFRQ